MNHSNNNMFRGEGYRFTSRRLEDHSFPPLSQTDKIRYLDHNVAPYFSPTRSEGFFALREKEEQTWAHVKTLFPSQRIKTAKWQLTCPSIHPPSDCLSSLPPMPSLSTLTLLYSIHPSLPSLIHSSINKQLLNSNWGQETGCFFSWVYSNMYKVRRMANEMISQGH